MYVLDTPTLWKYIGFARMASLRAYLTEEDSGEQYDNEAITIDLGMCQDVINN